MHVTSRMLSSTVGHHGFRHVAVIGAGLMGSGIAQVTAAANIEVSLVDINPRALDKAIKNIEHGITKIAEKKFPDNKAAQFRLADGVLSNIHTTKNLQDAVEHADMVIESVIEDVDLKRQLFTEVEKYTEKTTLFVTNTSSLQLQDIANALKDPARLAGMHFFIPVPIMKLVEVVRHEKTSDWTFNQLLEFGEIIGKTTVECKDTPGFVVNRLLIPYILEAIRLVERGDASYEDVDTAMKLGAGYLIGPFELADYIGLDTIKSIIDGWHGKYPKEPLFAPVESINTLVALGRLGRKSGRGFYKY